ncbi:hypothetical protein BOTBODRAFT_38893 [Botryobasidium botryosum FD-172 SS1]|uniref:Uncharacterized protein n=1 Tax=Botryobasidium botryosum (strain FD-172 SS1) TaxID=930990 RepID=A0A067LVL7_BOTB1|nr:hypothetical protein BOTBODRAFT_38893 [Botryobasidium botryosum FD-172 SS1]
MDGNNSLKRFANAGPADKRVFHSTYFLSDEYADKIKDEVKPRKQRGKKVGSAAYGEDDDQEIKLHADALFLFECMIGFSSR